MNKLIKIIGIIGCCAFLGCSKSDDGKSYAAPEISYGQNTIETPFHTTGSSVLPTIDWNGNVGSFGLENTMESVSIDAKTGLVSWGKTLRLGTNTIKIIAFNNAGSNSTTLQLEHAFIGNFKGDYDPFHTPMFTWLLIEFNFRNNGALAGFTQRKDLDGIILSTTPLEGTWSRIGNNINAEFILKEDGAESELLVLKGTLAYSEMEAYIDGTFQPEIDDGIRPTNFHVAIETAQ